MRLISRARSLLAGEPARSAMRVKAIRKSRGKGGKPWTSRRATRCWGLMGWTPLVREGNDGVRMASNWRGLSATDFRDGSADSLNLEKFCLMPRLTSRPLGVKMRRISVVGNACSLPSPEVSARPNNRTHPRKRKEPGLWMKRGRPVRQRRARPRAPRRLPDTTLFALAGAGRLPQGGPSPSNRERCVPTRVATVTVRVSCATDLTPRLASGPRPSEYSHGRRCVHVRVISVACCLLPVVDVAHHLVLQHANNEA